MAKPLQSPWTRGGNDLGWLQHRAPLPAEQLWPSSAFLGREGLVGASSMQAVPPGWDLKQPELSSTQEGKKPEQRADVTRCALLAQAGPHPASY